MKQCSLCKQIKPFDQFHKSCKAKDGHQYRCKPCAIQARIDHYYSDHKINIQKNAARAAVYSETNHAYVSEHLRRHPCVDCGESDPIVLEFDHVRGTKDFNISACYPRYALPKVIKEIAKCEVRCANCHRRVTSQRSGWRKK